MAIVLDATSSGQATATNVQFTHTVGAALTNKLLVVCISAQDSNHANLPVVAVLYGASSLTKVREDGASSNNTQSDIWYMFNPPAGAGTIEVDTSGSVHIQAIASSWSGVKQSAQPDASAGTGTANNNSNTPSQSITTVADNSLVIDAISSEANRTSLGGSQTNLGTVQGQSFENLSASYLIKTPAGSQTMSAGLSSGQPWSYSVASFSPAAAASGLPPGKLYAVRQAVRRAATY